MKLEKTFCNNTWRKLEEALRKNTWSKWALRLLVERSLWRLQERKNITIGLSGKPTGVGTKCSRCWGEPI